MGGGVPELVEKRAREVLGDLARRDVDLFLTRLRRWWADLEEAFSEFRMEVEAIEPAGGGRFLTTQRFLGQFRATGLPFDGPWAAVVTIRDGRIVHAIGYVSKGRALRALAGSGT